jgi:hypothetical protein
MTLANIHDGIEANGEYLVRKVSDTESACSIKYAASEVDIKNAVLRIEKNQEGGGAFSKGKQHEKRWYP